MASIITNIAEVKSQRGRVQLNRRGLTDLVGLNTPAAEYLYIRDNDLENLESLPHLPSLKILDVGNNRVSDLAGSGSAPNLRQLYANSNAVTSITSAPSLRKLEHLSLAQNPLASLEGAPELPALKLLSLAGTRVANLQGAPVFPKLQAVRLTGTPLETALGPIYRPFLVAAAGLNSLLRLDATAVSDADRAAAAKIPTSLRVYARMGFMPSKQAVAEGLDAVAAELNDFASAAAYGEAGELTVTDGLTNNDATEGNAISISAPATWERWLPATAPVIVAEDVAEYTPALADIDAALVIRTADGAVVVVANVVEHSPQANNVVISAQPGSVAADDDAVDPAIVEGGVMHVSYDYVGGREGPTRFVWHAVDPASGVEQQIAETETPELRLQLAQVGSLIAVDVVPARASDGAPGPAARAVTAAPVSAAQPVALEFDVAPLSGAWMEGDVVRATAQYFGGVRGVCRLAWYRADICPENEIVAARGAEALRLAPEDVGRTLTAVFTPVSAEGRAGRIVSFVSPTVLPGVPVARDVRFVAADGVDGADGASTGDVAAVENVPIRVVYRYAGGREGATLITWLREDYRKETGTVFAPIAGATGAEYTPGLDDVGRRLRVKVKPVRADGAAGRGVAATTVRPVAAGPPTCVFCQLLGGIGARDEAADLAEGPLRRPWLGETICTASAYSGGREGTISVSWERSRPIADADDEAAVAAIAALGPAAEADALAWTPIPGATDDCYTVNDDDAQCFIRAVFTPISRSGAVGLPVAERTAGPVEAWPVTFTSPSLSGVAGAGANLVFEGEFHSPDGDAEGASEFSWQAIDAAALAANDITAETVLELADETGRTLFIDTDLIGKCLRCVVRAVDATGHMGEWQFTEWSGEVPAKTAEEIAEEIAAAEAEARARAEAEARARAAAEAAAEAERCRAAFEELQADQGVTLSGIEILVNDVAVADGEVRPGDRVTARAVVTAVDAERAADDAAERVQKEIVYEWLLDGESIATGSTFTPEEAAVDRQISLRITMPGAEEPEERDVATVVQPPPPVPSFLKIKERSRPDTSGHIGAAWRTNEAVDKIKFEVFVRTPESSVWAPVPEEQVPAVATGRAKAAFKLIAADVGSFFRLKLTPFDAAGAAGEAFEAEIGPVEVAADFTRSIDAQWASGSARLEGFSGDAVAVALTTRDCRLLNSKGKAVAKFALKKGGSVEYSRDSPANFTVITDKKKKFTLEAETAADASDAVLTLRAFFERGQSKDKVRTGCRA